MTAPPSLPATPATTERLLTLKQVAELAGASRWTIWRWCAECGLRTVKIGGVTRIRERDWIAFLDRHAGAATEGGKE